jgi:hypothetical protein
MSLSLMDWMNLCYGEKEEAMTREEFGRVMHDDSISESKKLAYLEKVEQLGGYDGLSE